MKTRFRRDRWLYAATVATTAILMFDAANAADSDLCVFIKKVVATQKAEFSTFKGDEDTSLGGDHTMYNGALTPAPNTECKLYVRRKVDANDKHPAPPLYSCTLAHEITYDDAESRYADVSTEIKTCLPDWKYSESKNGGREKHDEAWEFVATKPGIVVKTSFFDYGAIAAAFNGTTSSTPGVSLSLEFEDTAPGPKNAHLPVVGKGTN
ncbi:MAG: hypothetical protein KGJ28_14055 [Alphaproteobacteria bacterium]|nr:hypothetical protein [Alphaproteobacteria bacterium]